VGTKPFKDQFPSFYNIVHYPQKVVADVMIQMPPNITFRRALAGDKLTTWHNLVAKIADFHLSNGRDVFAWSMHRHGEFSIRPMYSFLINQDTPFNSKFIWNLKFPLKIKIFL
jgi:hypothetical protein